MLTLSRGPLRVLWSSAKAVSNPCVPKENHGQEHRVQSNSRKSRCKTCCHTTVRNITTSAIAFNFIPRSPVTLEVGQAMASKDHKQKEETVKLLYDIIRMNVKDRHLPTKIPEELLKELMKETSSRNIETLTLRYFEIRDPEREDSDARLAIWDDPTEEDLKGMLKLRRRLFLTSFYKDQRTHMHYNLVFQTKRFGFPILFDFSDPEAVREYRVFLSHISKQETARFDYQRLHIILSNVNDRLWSELQNPYLTHVHQHLELFTTVTHKSYLDLFPREDLIFVLNTGREMYSAPVMKRYNPRYVYVFFVNKSNAYIERRARREGIRYAQLPLHLYKGPSLAIKEMHCARALRVISHLHASRDWEESIQKIYYRKLHGETEYVATEKYT